MCQAYEGERRSILAGEARGREARHVLDGAMARQEGAARSDWETLVHTVDRAVPDDATRLWTPSWWFAHHFDGPLIAAWLAGWDAEDERIAAGGRPLSRDDRARIGREIERLDACRWDAREGRPFRAADVARICRMADEEEAARRYEAEPHLRFEVGVAWVDGMAAVAKLRVEAGVFPSSD